MRKKALLLIAVLVLFLITGFAGTGKTAGKNKEEGMSGIVFFTTQQLNVLKEFYINRVGCTLWLDQGGCMIFKHGNFLFGFCQRDKTDTCGMLTFFYKDRKEVDRMYKEFKDLAQGPPKENPKYKIYHFFAKDPDGRAIEFQYFLDPIDWNF